MNTYTVFCYRDARAAIDWLMDAFGFTGKEVHAGDDGVVLHAELRAGNGLNMTRIDHEDDDWGLRAGTGWVYIAVDDPEGNHWSFGTYAP